MTTAAVALPRASRSADPSPWRSFFSVLRRDITVTGRELPIFLAQVILQPLGLLFIFGKVLGSIGSDDARDTRTCCFPASSR